MHLSKRHCWMYVFTVSAIWYQPLFAHILLLPLPRDHHAIVMPLLLSECRVSRSLRRQSRQRTNCHHTTVQSCIYTICSYERSACLCTFVLCVWNAALLLRLAQGRRGTWANRGGYWWWMCSTNAFTCGSKCIYSREQTQLSPETNVAIFGNKVMQM